MARVLGTPGNDILFGTFADDVLLGQAGNDILNFSEGNDTLDGGSGSDTADYSNLFGSIALLPTGTVNKFGFSFGTDQLIKVETIIAPQFSFFGDSSVIDASTSGSTVSIAVNLANNSLIVNGVPGSGTLSFTVINFRNVTGTSQNDSIIGDAQSNFLSGLAGNDLLDGGLGSDFLNGGAGDDQLFGGEGDDILIASEGNDTLNGGNGFDTADYTSLFNSITLLPTGTVNKFGFIPEADQLVNIENIIAPFFSNSSIDASTASAGVSIDVNLNNNSLVARNIPGVGIRGFFVQNFTNVIGSSGNDSIGGNFQNNSLSGGAGDDSFISSDGFDSIDGGDGFDTADYSNLSGSITLLSTGTVNKFSFFGFGTDQLFKVDKIIAPIDSFSNIDASTAIGTISVNVNLTNGSLIVNNVPGLGTLNFTVQNFTNVTGTFQSDSIIGNAQNNFLSGLGGNDLLIGGGGNDNLEGSFGNDFLDSGSGDDFLNGDLGDDKLVSGQGNDFLNGGAGSDTADYSALDQAITLEAVGIIDKGTAGTDQILGIETIIGAIGKANAIDGSTGTSNSTFFDIDLTANRLTVNDIPFVGSATFKVLNFANATGTTQDDSILGNSKGNVFQGGRGDDVLSGEGGNDTLFGQEGNDTLTGGTGNDTLVGGIGIDILRGGTGADKFQFSTPIEGIDTILDFVSGSDKVTISLAGFGAGLTKGTLATSRFVLGANALDANDRFIYTAGQLFFDRDGSGGAAKQQIATLTGAVSLVASDISII